MNELRSSLDNHNYDPEYLRDSVCVGSTISEAQQNYAIACKTPSLSLKMKDLASNLLG